MDCKGISTLTLNGFTLQEALLLLENKHNTITFNRIVERLDNGESITSFLTDYVESNYRSYLSGFLQFINFSNALALTIKISEGNEQNRKKYLNGTIYPFTLLFLTIIGILLFNNLCFPPLLSMMKSFDLDLATYESIHSVLNVISYSFIVVIIFVFILLFIFMMKKNVVKTYKFFQKYIPDSLITLFYTNDFIRFYLECIKINISTKDSINILKSMTMNPVVSFIANEIDIALCTGIPFEQALSNPLLDSSLFRFLKIAIFSSNMEEMLNGYLLLSEERTAKQIKAITKTIQIVAYFAIGLMLVVVYQMLMLPMSIIAQI